ncbi:MAG: F0F1 ATP synthase subunit delta [Deltaproteobacteria bacterium]|nr:F0F1 ATP synthase subunit delta [Deltaproteobacteria bacterium]
MIGSDIANRYARALFEIAREEDALEKTYSELQQFSSILHDNENLREFLANPIFDLNDKKSVVIELLEKMKISLMTANFLKLLVDKRRIDTLPEIEACFRTYVDDVLNKARVNVSTAFPLTNELTERIKTQLEKMTGKTIEMDVHEDTTLVGGIVVRIGDTLYDGSIRAQLNSIRELIREEI